MGQWYGIELLCIGNKGVRIWDSLKKFPGCSVETLAKMYGIAGKKDKPDFSKYIPENYQPTEDEVSYCVQDSKIVAYAIYQQLLQGYESITLSSDAFNCVKELLGGHYKWRNVMPELPIEMDDFARCAYKGGWVYVNPIYQGREVNNIQVYDVNSLYPWVMHDCELPLGPGYAHRPYGNQLSILRFETIFKLETGFPTIQIKHNIKYSGTEYLKEVNEPVTLTMTNIDYELFTENYQIEYMSEPEYLSFNSKKGLLAPYIDKWMKVKEESTYIPGVQEGNPAVRYISKRYMNSPYGKTGMKPTRINKVPRKDEDYCLRYDIDVTTIDGIYVPYAAFVCAWARDKTIRTAQSEQKAFVYADTDSVHLVDTELADELVDPVKLGYWKHEGTFQIGKYVRPKTYIHATNENSEYQVTDVTCAGMPNAVKEHVTWNNFIPGNEFKGKLQQKQVPGGCLLVETTFRISE